MSISRRGKTKERLVAWVKYSDSLDKLKRIVFAHICA